MHLCRGRVAAIAARNAFPGERRIGDDDRLDFGPLCDDPVRLQQIRSGFRRRYHLDDVAGPSMTYLLESVADEELHDEKVCLWVGRHLCDQVFVCAVLSRLRRLGVAAKHVDVVFAERTCLGAPLVSRFETINLQSGSFSARALRRTLTIPEIDQASAAWEALIAADPHAVTSWLSATPLSAFNFRSAFSSLLGHFPDARSGLDVWQLVLMRSCSKISPRSAIVVPQLGALYGADVDCPSDELMFGMLRELDQHHVPHPLLLETPDPKAPHLSCFELTPLGREVLEGRQNHIALNGIDTWVGGVHLSSAEGNVWVRDGDNLVRWP